MATNKKSALARTLDEPSFVLHRYPWSESSLVLDVFTRHQGRVVLVAKGAKRPHSNFRPILMPLQPLSLGFSGEQEVRNLSSAEWSGGHVMPQGESLLSGFYLNELLLKLLAREDPHPELFDVYKDVVKILSGGFEQTLGPLLRTFELLMLSYLGHLPNLTCQTATLEPIKELELYRLMPEVGLAQAMVKDIMAATDSSASREVTEPVAWDTQSFAHRSKTQTLSGRHWMDLSKALQSPNALTSTLRLCAEMDAPSRQALQSQLRQVIHFHCGLGTLKTRQFMIDIQAL
ncbi:MAG: DNA repair protein RecO [Burkholderiaceae bacterium]